MKVKAAVARSGGEALRLEGLTLDEARPDEILVKMVACGVARADLDAIDGRLAMPLPFVPGTEGAGIVERVGDEVSHLHPGDAVILCFDYCGRCEACTAGRPRACVAFEAYNVAGHRLDGSSTCPEQDVNGRFFGQSSFATHVLCRASRAIKVAKGSPLEALACLGGEFLAGAGVILEAFHLKQGDSLVVVGADAVGLAAIMVARAQGAATIVVADADERRRTLASELGATAAVHTAEPLAELVRSLVADGADFAIETTGSTEARQACLGSLIEQGSCAVVGTPEESAAGSPESGKTVAFAADYVRPATLIPKLTAIYARGDLPLEQLVDFFPFEHVNDALEALRGGAVAKPVLRFSIGAFGDFDRANVEGAVADKPADAPTEPPAQGDRILVKS